MHEPVSGREYLTRFVKASVVCTLIAVILATFLGVFALSKFPPRYARPANRPGNNPEQPIVAFGQSATFNLVTPGTTEPALTSISCAIPQSLVTSAVRVGSRVILLARSQSQPCHLYELNAATGAAVHLMGPDELGSAFAIAAIGSDLYARDDEGIMRISLDSAKTTRILALPWKAPAGAFIKTPIHTGFAATATELAFVAEPGVVGFFEPATERLETSAVPNVSRITSAVADAVHVQCGLSHRLLPRPGSTARLSRWLTRTVPECHGIVDIGEEVWAFYSGGGYENSLLINLDRPGEVRLALDSVNCLFAMPSPHPP